MICRTAHNKNYTIVNNTICKDNRLSWKAKGIWLYAFSRPDDWTFHVEDLIKQSTDGKDAVRSGLQELQKFGYLKMERIRNTDGTLGGNEWVFYEIPQFKENVPQPENPILDNPVQENPPLLNTDLVTSTEAASKQAAFALLAALPFDDDEKKSFVASFNVDQCKRAVAFYKAKIALQPDFTPDKGWLPFLAAAIHQNWPIPEKPIKSSSDPKTKTVDIEANKAKAEQAFDELQSILAPHEEILIFKESLSYKDKRKGILMNVIFIDPQFDEKLTSIRKIIVTKR